MANEIMSILQPIAPQRTGASVVRTGSGPTVVSSASASTDRLSLTASAQSLQAGLAKPGQSSAPIAADSDVNMTYSRTGDGFAAKGTVTLANGRQFGREVAVTFDREAQTVSREVTITGQGGREVTRSTSLSRTDNGFEAVTRRVGVRGNETVREAQVVVKPSEDTERPAVGVDGQRPSPALANMMQAFYTTADMDGFDAASDLNADGVINFQDLAALRAQQSGGAADVGSNADAMVASITDALFTDKGSEGFDASVDLNADGMVNFQDLALLRQKLEGA